MLDFKPVKIEDKILINSFLHQYHHNSLEYLFTTLFAWQEGYGFEWDIFVDKWLILKSTFENRTACFCPLGPNKNVGEALQAISEWFEAQGLPLTYTEVLEEDLVVFKNFYAGQKFEIVPRRDLANYVYQIKNLIALKGNIYKEKRNHISHFCKICPDWKFLPIDADTLPLCKDELKIWFEQKHRFNDSGIIIEKQAIDKIFNNLADLDCFGFCLVCDDKVVAFTLGEALTKDTAAILLEKANKDLRGAFAMIHKLYLEASWQKFTFVNRGEDLGDPGLKKAKESYQPSQMVMKYDILFYMS